MAEAAVTAAHPSWCEKEPQARAGQPLGVTGARRREQASCTTSSEGQPHVRPLPVTA